MADVLKIATQALPQSAPSLTDAAVRPVAPAAAPPPLPATLQNLPQALVRLPANAVLQGVLVSTGLDGSAQIRTPQGTLTVALQNPPPAGTAVSLTLQGTPGAGSAATLTLQTGSQPSAAPGGTAAAPAAASPAPAAVLAGGRTVPAVVTAAATAAAPPPAPATIPDALRPALAAPTGQPAAANPALAEGARVSLRIAPAAPGGVPAPGTIPAVVAQGAGGTAVLQTALGTLRLDGGTALAPGTRLSIEIASAAPPRPAAPGAGIASPLGLARDWPALKEALAALAAANPAAARGLEAAIPRAGGNLGTSMLFLMSALQLGDPKAFLGDAALRALRGSSAELAARIADDFLALARLSSAGGGGDGDWRTWILPLHDGDALRQVRLFTRNQKRKSRARDEETDATRFIVELELSNLGLMQIDGFTHDHRFDLMIRTADPLPAAVRDGIRSIYQAYRGDSGERGDLGVQDSTPFPVTPIDSVETEHFGVSI